MDVLSRAEDTVLAMHSEDDFGRPDILTSISFLRSAFPLEESHASFTLSGPAQNALIARQKAVSRSLKLWKDRDQTVTVTKAAGLIMCLYPWTPPPDAEPRTHPTEVCWLDTSNMQLKDALETIGNAMQAQYEGYVHHVTCI